MIHRLLYRIGTADAIFLLALSGAAYHHTDRIWLLYAVYITTSITLLNLLQGVATWIRYIGDAISFHAKCIRDKNFDVGLKADINHLGKIDTK